MAKVSKKRNNATGSPFGLANIGVHFEFLVLGSVKVKVMKVMSHDPAVSL